MIDRSDPWHLAKFAAAEDAHAVGMDRLGPVLPLERQIGIWPKQNVPATLMKPLFAVPGETCFALLDGSRVTNLPEILERSKLPRRGWSASILMPS